MADIAPVVGAVEPDPLYPRVGRSDGGGHVVTQGLHSEHASARGDEPTRLERRPGLKDVDVGEPGGYEGAFEAMAQKGSQALLVVASPKFDPDRKLIFALAARRRIPAIYGWDFFAAEGGLMGYGPSRAEMDRRAASLVDKILKGANPGDLPIEQPTKFELGINLRTAKALGLAIPQSLLLHADLVVE